MKNKEDKFVYTITKRKLKEYEFACEGCNKIHLQSSYAVAQLRMGNAIVHTCDCGYKTEL